MHVVIEAGQFSDLDERLSKYDIESCDLFVADWACGENIISCVETIKKHFDKQIYIITDNIPIPAWVFGLGAQISVIWMDQDPSNIALCQGSVEIDLYSLNHLDVLDCLNNISHFLYTEPLKVKKKCLVKESRSVEFIQNAESKDINALHEYLR
jgi:hypothetical protein